MIDMNFHSNPNQELKLVDGRYEIWATGSVASCDYAGMIFGYGYKAVAVFVPLVYILVAVYTIRVSVEAKKSETLELKATKIEGK